MGNEKVVEFLFNLKQQKEEQASIRLKEIQKEEEMSFKTPRTGLTFKYARLPSLPFDEAAKYFIENGARVKDHDPMFKTMPRGFFEELRQKMVPTDKISPTLYTPKYTITHPQIPKEAG